MHEIAELADESTVFRNGANVATYLAGTKTDNEVIEMMIGRETATFSAEARGARQGSDAAVRSEDSQLGGPPARHLVHRRRWRNRRLGGLDGQGQRELLLALFGVLRGVSGEIRVGGAPASPRARTPRREAHRHGADPRGPEDGRLMLPMSVRENLSFAALQRVSKGGMIDRARETKLVGELMELLEIHAAGTDIPAGSLSAAISRRWSSPSG